nr:hypothetical protein [Candidatus Freyrarchaeum guaymaensis]
MKTVINPDAYRGLRAEALKPQVCRRRATLTASAEPRTFNIINFRS